MNKDSAKIRITDRGAISGITVAVNTLLFISNILAYKKVDKVEDLVSEIKSQLKKYLIWLDRIPDATLYADMSKKEVDLIKKEAKDVLGWGIILSESDLKRRSERIKEFESVQKDAMQAVPADKKLVVLMDTSFLLSYVFKDQQFDSANFIIQYLKTQKDYTILYMTNINAPELISKMNQKYQFKQTIKKFNDLLGEIADGYLMIDSGEKINIYSIFDKYKLYSRKKIAKNLRGNDFIIATEGIEHNALILTCDKPMYDNVKKFYPRIFFIDKSATSYRKFFHYFEREKEKIV
jgi:predicted nucleic acid-binding protein